MSAMLVLARHGQSEGNRNNVFTGRDDPPLTDDGKAEACAIAMMVQHARIEPNVIFTSAMKRTRDTARIIVQVLGASIPIVSNPALNERDYGKLTGMNKNQAAVQFGAEQVLAWRRSYQKRPPDGESLSDTRQRVVAYFNQAIAPRLRNGENVVVVGHGNCLRALAMELEGLSPQGVETFEIATGQPLFYEVAIEEAGLKAVAVDPRCQPVRSAP